MHAVVGQSISHLKFFFSLLSGRRLALLQIRIGFKRVVSVGVRNAAHGGWRVDVDGMSLCAVNGCPYAYL